MSTSANQIKAQLNSLASKEMAASAQRFFKTGPGEYGEGDQFIGIKVPVLRKLSRQVRDLPLDQIEKLLCSPVHEHRHLALMVLVLQVSRCEAAGHKRIFEFYLANTEHINNWDLVDCSAPAIVGGFLLDKPRTVLGKLATSKDLWERRISIVATQQLIRHNQFQDTVAIARKLIQDKHDLIHKATGWMLREMGQRDQSLLEDFLTQFASQMPRTMLRYAIEKLTPAQRKMYMQMK